MKKIVIIIIALIICSSCASNKKESIGDEQLNITETNVSTNETSEDEEVLVEQKIATSQGENVILKAKFSIDFPQMRNSANAVIEMARMDSVLLTITGPFGISVGKLYANRNEFIMNNTLQSISFMGAPSEETIMKVINIPLSFDDIVTLLRTSLPNKRAFSNGVSSIKDGKLMQYERIDNDDNVVMKVNFFEHNIISGYDFAKKIVMSFPTFLGKVTIEISDVIVGGKLTSPMQITTPKSYKVINYSE